MTKVKPQDITYGFIIVMVCSYVFSSLSWRIIIPSSAWGLFVAVAGIISTYQIAKHPHVLKDKSVLLLLLMYVVIIFNRNYDIKNYGTEKIISDIIPRLIGGMVYCACISYNKWNKYFKSTTLLLSNINTLSTIILTAIPSLYYSFVLPTLHLNYASIYKRIPNPTPAAGITVDYGNNACFIVFGLSFVFAAFVAQSMQHSQRHQYNLIIQIVYMMIALIFCAKRSAFLGLIVAALVFYIAFEKKKDKYFKLILIIASTLIFILIGSYFFASFSNLLDRFSFLNSDVEDTSISTRYVMWEFAIEGFKDSPLIGQGWRWVNNTDFYRGTRDAHNTYLQLLAENGIIGAFPFFSFFSLSLYRAIKNVKNSIRYKQYISLSYAMAGFVLQVYMLVYMAVTTFFYSSTMFMYYLLTCAMVSSQYIFGTNNNPSSGKKRR